LLSELAKAISAYVIMQPYQCDAAALGAVFAHTHDFRDTAPIFFIVSPTKRCGKSRLERVIKRLVPKPLMASSATPAFLARVIEKHRPTVLIDEFDATAAGDRAMAETLRGQLNSSFDRDGAKVGRCVPLPGGGYDEREYSTWAATWIASIKKIPDTVKDRGVVLQLKRKLPGQMVARFRGKDGGELNALRRKTARWVADNEQRLRDIEPSAPKELEAVSDRAADAWDPLFSISDTAGGEWPRRAREVALALVGIDVDDQADGDIDVELLSDINHVLRACDSFAPTPEQLKNNKHIAVEALEALRQGAEQPDGGGGQTRRIVGLGAEQLTNALATFPERKWPAWDNGKPMRPHQLAKLLGAYEIKSRTLRDGDVVFRGYPRDRLDDALERYLVSFPPISRSTERAGENELFGTVTDPACNASKKAGDANKSGACNDVTARTEGERGSKKITAARPLISPSLPRWTMRRTG
jgi:putative DNA primase/helicase